MSFDDVENVDRGICAGDHSGAGRGEGHADIVRVSSPGDCNLAIPSSKFPIPNGISISPTLPGETEVSEVGFCTPAGAGSRFPSSPKMANAIPRGSLLTLTAPQIKWSPRSRGVKRVTLFLLLSA
jgi:hypothetical protein